jgi:hypothetical protein
MKQEGHKVSRAQFEKNIAEKLHDAEFAADIGPLLAAGFTWDVKKAAPVVSSRLNAVGLAGKAQCNNVRTFALHRDTGYMYEVKLGKGVSICKNPAPASDLK